MPTFTSLRHAPRSFLFAVAVIGLGGAGRGARACGRYLDDRPTFTGRDIDRLQRAAGEQFSPAKTTAFLREGLPELHRLATENGITIGELIEDIHAGVALSLDAYYPEDAKFNELEMRNRQLRYAGLESLIGRTKLKANHHAKLKAIMVTLETSARVLARSQIRTKLVTTINPFAMMTSRYITDLLTAAEDGLFDQALLDTEGVWRSLYEKERMADLRAALAKPSKINPPEAITPLTAAEVEAGDPLAVISAADLVPETKDDTNLGVVIQADRALAAGVPYQARTSRGQLLSVRLAPYLVKQHDDGERFVVRRLLRGILVGRRHAGVKLLSAVGPKIIEVKAILHGHKRILGCLDGRDLNLLYLVDIKADGSTYSRRIPRDLCGPSSAN